ncbi:hypothetical protein KC361_g8970 [Hortaea werneckii]|nr:hypothetical protein KC361_g8970 [Hortaea werneckii]
MLGLKHVPIAWAAFGSLLGTAVTQSTNTNTTAATSDCPCGFVDNASQKVYSDSIIVYFNETDQVPSDIFAVDSFEHEYEIGWNIYYREGAVEKNAYFEEGSDWSFEGPTHLNLNVSGATPEHLVNGAQLQSVRQDIQYGTFRALMKSPQPWAAGGGSALSMRLWYNETSSAELDLMNMDDSTNNAQMRATVSNNDEDLSWVMNYTTLETPEWAAISPWDFWEWRMEWDRDTLAWYSSYNQTHNVSTAQAQLVDVPTAAYFKHWSLGDEDWMQGPPTSDSMAAVGWVRFFFNTSGTTTSKIDSQECDANQLCSVDDMTLRLSTDYTSEATHRPSAESLHQPRSKTAGIALIAISLAFSAALLIFVLLQKWNDRRQVKRAGAAAAARPKMPKSPMPSEYMITSKSRPESEAFTTQTDVELHNLGNQASSTTLIPNSEDPPWVQEHKRTLSQRPLLGHHDSTAASSTTAFSPSTQTPGVNPFATPASERNNPYIGSQSGPDAIEPFSEIPLNRQQPTNPATPADRSTADLLAAGKPLPQGEPEGSAAAANPGAKADVKPNPPAAGAGAPPVARTRVDYLAGLVAVCSLIVSCTHFILTFVPHASMEYIDAHYSSEDWARRTIGPFFFNEIWVGLFFTTSTRFLTTGYLRNGKLRTIAEKIVCRTPRLMIPIAAVILFEYFLMDLGATKYLEYIPSITWSTWPSTEVYNNFGWFINETLQIIYLIPNAAPQLTWNFCTGVLWTIPVQLQNSWLVLLGVVIIKEIKTPWKRFGYYGFVIINHWYGLSWGSYFWFGLMMADLDITYKYRKFIQSRWWVHYPMMTLASILVFVCLANDLLSIWVGWTFSTEERNIHPEFQSGYNLGQTEEAGYPDYTEPKLNGLIFAVASQYIVELSTWVQACLSTKVFLWLFPHVFTIYLIHGLVFWSIGSLVCVFFAAQGLAYWLNMLLTALICYVTLFASLPIVTPVMEMLGKEITKGIWISASEEPAPWRPSTYPFTIDEIREMVYRRDDEEGDGYDGKGKGRAA